jgi:hypothetical protein
MTNMKKFIIAILILLTMMYAEYRIIMVNLHPYKGDNGTVYIEFIGRVDEYYADPVSELFN